MGAKLCCLGFTKSRKDANEPLDNHAAKKPVLTWQDLLVPLPPNLVVNRLEAQLPAQSLMSVPMYLRLHRFLPPHIQRRKLELVYASWEHGFSLTAFKACLSDRRASRHASVNQEVVILIRPALNLPMSPMVARPSTQQHPQQNGQNSLPGSPHFQSSSAMHTSPSTSWGDGSAAAEAGTPVVGAFLPTGIDFHSKKYHGADTMFVFTNIADGFQGMSTDSLDSAATGGAGRQAGGQGNYGATATGNNSSSQQQQHHHAAVSSFATTNSSSLSSTFGVVDRPTVYTTSHSPKVNEYYVRASDGMIVFGGGGKGAAIAVNDDLDTLTSSIMCPTFQSGCLLPVERGSHGSDSPTPSGVQVEGFLSKAPIHTLEVWGISNFPLTIPEGFEDEDLQKTCKTFVVLASRNFIMLLVSPAPGYVIAV
ncbi:Hypothetical protein, putative [Bodo saltans]|uniref:Oxidation resistance protein 1 n=1 Tax=Bodo saltans TaxID=75058 RepID=A0A0S4IUY3_BODSA|nr:Hypothetical protein, putative [Bodo saltans]|eukprot:CUF43012.1 Hypothetical protein, putative [Bodo saltans]